MKKIILICTLTIILGIFSYNYIREEDTTKNIKYKKINNKVKSNYVKKEKSLYKSEVPKVDQEYTLYVSKTSYVKKESSNIKEDVKDNIENTILDNAFALDNSENMEEKETNSDINILEESKTEETIKKKDDNNKVEDDSDLNEKEEITTANEENTNANENNLGVKQEEKIEIKSSVKNGFYNENGNTYYYENDNKVTGIKNINGVNNYFSPIGKYLGTTKVKVIDVSYYQKDINWDLFYQDSDCYGVILRLGYWTTLDKKFERNISELKRLNIPYGIYLFSYSTTTNGALKEANFTNSMIDKYDIKPSLGIYYDLESWKTNSSSSDGISKNQYNYIARKYVEMVKAHVNNNYPVGIYSGRWYAMNRLGKTAKSYVSWVAEYNSTLKYDGPYFMWQYTSKGSVPGISGNVDISYIMN